MQTFFCLINTRKSVSIETKMFPNVIDLCFSFSPEQKQNHPPEPTRPSRGLFAWRGFSSNTTSKMAASSSGGALKDLVHPSLNETLKTQNSVTFKLVKTGESKLEFLDVNKRLLGGPFNFYMALSERMSVVAINTAAREESLSPPTPETEKSLRDNCVTKKISCNCRRRRRRKIG